MIRDKGNKIDIEVKLEKAVSSILEHTTINKSIITKYLRNMFKPGKLNQKSNVQKMHIPFSDKLVKFYSLNAIVSVDCRVNF